MTEATHHLFGAILGKGEFSLPIDLGEREHGALRHRCMRVVVFLEQQSYSLVLRNYDTLTGALDLGRNYRPTGHIEPTRALVFEIQLAALDWLLATRLYLDHTRFELCDRFGTVSVEVNGWDELRRAEHRDHRGYRILYELRDYCAHTAGCLPWPTWSLPTESKGQNLR